MELKSINRQIALIVLLIFFSIASICFHYAFTNTSIHDDQDFHILLSKNIHDSIENLVDNPIFVASTMATDSNIIELLENEDKVNEKEATETMAAWLSSIQKASEFDSVFLISDSSHRFYTTTGLLKAEQPLSDSLNIWYQDSINRKQATDINIATDPDNDKKWTLFINKRITDSNEKVLGICGVGILMKDLQELFLRYENQYKIKINLVNEDGLTEVDTETINIQTTYHTTKTLSPSKEYNYTHSKSGQFIVTSFIEQLGWYLIVRNSGDSHDNSVSRLKFLLSEILLFIILIVLCHILAKRYFSYFRKDNSKTRRIDQLTGLYNRNYFKDVYGERGIFNTTRYKSIAVFDIDFFKEANDTMDGDDILRKVTKCAKRTIGANGEIFRWGGDEFAVLMGESIDKAFEISREFCHQVAEAGQVTVSVGVTGVRLSDTIKKNYYRAAQGCYLVKEMGGNGVKKS